jgi:Single-strand binding protein family
MRYNAAIPSCLPIGAWNLWPDDGSRMSREAHVRFCESAGLRCPALLTYIEGRLTTRQYEAKDGSGTRYRTEIVAVQMRLLGNRTNGTAAPKQASDDIPF